MNGKGQVSDKAVLWDRLISELNDAGEFQVKSHFSDESQESEMAVLSQQPPQRSPLSQLGVDMPQGSMQRSQGRRDNVFNLTNRMEGMDIEQKEKVVAERRGNADAAVHQGLRMRQTMEKSMRMGGTGATASASRYVSPHRRACCLRVRLHLTDWLRWSLSLKSTSWRHLKSPTRTLRACFRTQTCQSWSSR